MLIGFSVKNFRSFKEKQEFSLAPTPLKGPTAPIAPEVRGFPGGLLRTAAIYGANASGKSNVLKALLFLSRAVATSHTQWQPEAPIPVEPFLLEDESREAGTEFEIEFLTDGTKFRYAFAVNSKQVLSESLCAFQPGEKLKKQTWFTRDAEGTPRFRFGRALKGENRVIENLTRANSLFLSAAAQNNHQMLSPVHNWLARSIASVEGPRRFMVNVTAAMCGDEETRRKVGTLLSQADFGVSSIRVSDEEIPPRMKRVLEAVWETMPKGVVDKSKFPEKQPRIELVHQGKGGSEVPLMINVESEGTVSFLSLLGPVLTALQSGGVLCVDELDTSLHPLLGLEILRMFSDSGRNPLNAQLIFNAHDTNLLDPTILRRDQIWFTEKDKDGGTHLYPLSDFNARQNENIKRGYLQGRFGAVPFLSLTETVDTARRRRRE